MTTTPHGQVPEALRLANVCSNLARYSMDAHLIAAELRRQHARIAELESELEAVGAGGVQALSAAPAGWKLVPEDATEEMVRATDKVNFANADTDGTMHNVWNVMLAASPTPTAEQQASATEVALVGAYARLPDFDSGDEPIWEAVFKWKAANPGSDASKKAMAVEGAIIKSLRDFADRTHALRMQAAPKAAPGELHDHQILAITTAYEQGVGKGHQAYNSGKEIANPYSPAYRCDLAWQYGYKEGKEQAAPKAAPGESLWPVDGKASRKQLIEQIGRMNYCLTALRQENAGLVSRVQGQAAALRRNQGAAPQPAPAPLSEMPYEKRKAIQEGEQIGASDAWFKARHEMLDTIDRRNVFRAGFDRGWNAALAAQGDTP